MRRRVLYWLGWTVTFAVIPFLLAYAFLHFNAKNPPTLADVFRSGEGLLVALALAAAGLGELRDAPPRRESARALSQWGIVVFLVLLMAAYGFVRGTEGANATGDLGVQNRVAWMTIATLAI